MLNFIIFLIFSRTVNPKTTLVHQASGVWMWGPVHTTRSVYVCLQWFCIIFISGALRIISALSTACIMSACYTRQLRGLFANRKVLNFLHKYADGFKGAPGWHPQIHSDADILTVYKNTSVVPTYCSVTNIGKRIWVLACFVCMGLFIRVVNVKLRKGIWHLACHVDIG